MMRGRKVIVTTIYIVFALAVSGCGKQTETMKSDNYGQMQKTSEDSGWKQVTSGQVRIENNDICMVMDTATGHFKIKDKKKNLSYHSAVVNDLKGAKIERTPQSQSELLAYYYDKNGQKQELSTYQNSVIYKTLKVMMKDSAVRVYYTLQLEETPPFVPQVLSDDMMKHLSEVLDSTTFFKVKLMYKYHLSKSDDTDANKIKKKYPYLKENNLYVLKENMSNTDRKSLSAYMEKASFDENTYYQELTKLKITLADEEVPLQFQIPVEYQLTEDGFKSRVLTDLITVTNKDFTLQSVAILPYFNCGTVVDDEGYWLLPDGCGAVMKTNKIDNKGYSQRIFGVDQACSNQITNVVEKSAVMPVLGFSSSNGSWFARIEGAAETAAMKVYRAGDTEYTTHGYAEFSILSTDSFKMRKSSVPLAVFAKEFCVENPAVSYTLLDKKSSIMDFAECYRKILIDKKVIKEIETNNNLYLDFTGYITEEASFMGVSYDKKVVLSRIKDIKEAVKTLREKGIENIYVRLTGYSDGGKYHGLINEFSLDSDVGTVKELEELADILKSTGGALYLEDDMYEVYRDSIFDGFSSTSDAVRALDKTIVDISSANIVTGKTNDKVHVRYMTAPKLYKSLAKNFSTTLAEQTKNKNILISIGNAGTYLISDFNNSDMYDRVQSRNAALDAVEEAASRGSFMTNTGNEYILGKSEHILNMPVANSSYVAENYHIPFYQIVLNGYCNYATESMNDAANQKKNQVWTILSGSNPYYTCVTDKKALEEIKGDQKKYPKPFQVLQEEIVQFYNANKELYRLVNQNRITDFEILEEGLYRIAYEKQNVLVNETDGDVKWNGQLIEANNYVIVGK